MKEEWKKDRKRRKIESVDETREEKRREEKRREEKRERIGYTSF